MKCLIISYCIAIQAAKKIHLKYGYIFFFIASDGQIEVSEFYGNVPKLQSLSLIGHCTRSRDKEEGTVVVVVVVGNGK